MPAAMVRLAESLSGYRHLYQPHDPKHADNPAAYSHYLCDVGGQTVSVLSRVAPCGTDYSGRTNKIAHHVIAEASERPECGPATLMASSGFYAESWQSDPRLIKEARKLTDVPHVGFRAGSWQSTCGDAGWAGKLAECSERDNSEPAYILYSPGTDVLALIGEALRLLPPVRRWQITFNTYFTAAPRSSSCLWRCCPVGPDARRSVRTARNALVLDITKPMGKLDDQGPLIESARTGKTPHWGLRTVMLPKSLPAMSVEPQWATDEVEDEPAPIRPPVSSRKRSVTIKRSAPAAPVTLKISRKAVWLGLAAGLVVAGVIWAIVREKRQPESSDSLTPPREVLPPGQRSVQKEPSTGDPATLPSQPNDISKTRPKQPRPSPGKDTNDQVRPLPPARQFHSLVPASPVALPATYRLPDRGEWAKCGYLFFGPGRRLVTGKPEQDVDRLKGVVRGTVYTIGSLGLTARVTAASLVFDHLAESRERNGRPPHALAIQSADEREVMVLWLRTLSIDADVIDGSDGVVFSVPVNTTLGLIRPLLVDGMLACNAAFAGSDHWHEIDYLCRPEGDGLTFIPRITEAQDEIIRGMNETSDSSLAETGVPEHRPARLLNYANLGQFAENIRSGLGSEGDYLSPLKLRIVIADLRKFVLDHCERPLTLKPAHPEAEHVESLLSAFQRRMTEAMRTKRPRRWDDNETPAEDDVQDLVQEETIKHREYFRESLLPSNSKLTHSAVREIVQSPEFESLLLPPDGGEPDEPPVNFQTREDNSPLAVMSLAFAPADRPYPPVLIVKRWRPTQ